VLARANRVVRADDFRTIVRRGRRSATDHLVVHRMSPRDPTCARFGFIVGKTVGNAVVRNRVRRRLRELARERIAAGATGDFVIRALPGSAEASWATLKAEIRTRVAEGGGTV